MTTFEIFNADCLLKMKDISNNSINLMIADLPYGETDCEWDSCIDLNKMWIELKRILKANGQVLFFCSTKFGCNIINSNPKWFRNDIVWVKSKAIGHLNSKKAVLRKHEMIYLFHAPIKPKDLKWTYNPQMVKGEPYSRGLITNSRIAGGVYGKQIDCSYHDNITGDRFPNSILKIGNSANNFKRIHPTEKPIELYEWLIKTYSNEGDVILDPTAGSFNSGIASRSLNRSYIGIEMNKEYFDKAVERMN